MEKTINAFRSGAENFGKPRVLVVADSEERLCNIKSTLHPDEVEISGAKTQVELGHICCEPHDVAIVDMSSAQLREALRTIRTSAYHSNIPVLVASDRIVNEKSLSGVLPEYRAMPCSPAEMAALINSRAQSMREVRAASLIL